MNWFYQLISQYNNLLLPTNGFSNVNLHQEASLILADVLNAKKPIFVIKENKLQAEKLETILSLLNPDINIVRYEQEESIRIEAIASSPEGFRERLKALYNLCHDQVDVVITSAPSFLRYLPKKEHLLDKEINLKVGDIITLNELGKRLFSIGYQRKDVVEQPLSYALRGGIIDVYSIQYNNPIRIEFFDDEIESIRFFDVETQQTIEVIDEACLFVASDQLLKESDKELIKKTIDKKYSSQLDDSMTLEIEQLLNGQYDPVGYQYFSLGNNLSNILEYVDFKTLLVSNRQTVERAFKFFINESVEFQKEQVEEGKRLPIFDQFINYERVLKDLPVVYFEQFQSKKESVIVPIHQLFHPQLEFEQLLNVITKEALSKKVVLSVNEKEIHGLVEQLIKADVPYSMVISDRLLQGINIQVHPLNEGFIYNDEIVVYSSLELFNVKTVRGRYEHQFKTAASLTGIADLKVGDYVVHRNYGIGRYIGLETHEVNYHPKDFLKIAYQNDDVLLVPLEQFKLVRKFLSSEGVSVKLSKLGSNAWQKTKDRIKNSVNDIADKLIALYQERQQQKGFAYSPDNELVKEFENEFNYELTRDQKTAIAEMKADMESSLPMDRLLCGDVGFGKTEVAIRGAFKAVVDNKQVVFLCPTTVLSQQHYRTFKERFKNYPVRIGLLNRFVPDTVQKEIIKEVKSGKIDILIGTHRVLSKDIKYKDLGFLIIDEEQRFGVAQKEKIKELKVNVDVLSLSATPIPRTLQMSLVGLRSLSQLNTPPSNRLPVVTHVVEKSEKLVYELIEKELNRQGQVFYLYNNTTNIYGVAYKLQQQFPSAQIGVAHGKMDRAEIEQVMVDFNNNDIQVLVCTTIVETGIDIPNANTMIIEGADRFGLSQLYQIKGRVGRSDRLAYAYLMVDPQKQLSEVATKRLEAIKEFTQLGSGYKIAMRDLTIRGAGELLGGNQSGFIDTVGMDLYIELLQEALAIKQNKTVEKPKETVLNLPNSGHIPDDYTSNSGLKIELYQQIDKIKSVKALFKFRQVMVDRYGKLDNSTLLLLEKKQLELFLEEEYIEDFKDRAKQYELVLTKEYSDQVDGVKLFEIMNSINNLINLKYTQSKITIIVPKSSEAIEQMVAILSKINEGVILRAN